MLIKKSILFYFVVFIHAPVRELAAATAARGAGGDRCFLLRWQIKLNTDELAVVDESDKS